MSARSSSPCAAVETSLVTWRGSASPGASRAIDSATRRPNTSPSSRLFDASRFAPCTPVAATSPQAHSPGRLVRPSRSVRTPPIM